MRFVLPPSLLGELQAWRARRPPNSIERAHDAFCLDPGLFDSISRSFRVQLPMKSVGVMGDAGALGPAVRAVLLVRGTYEE